MSTTMAASFTRLADPLSIFTNTKNESPFKMYLHPLNNLSKLTNSLFILEYAENLNILNARRKYIPTV